MKVHICLLLVFWRQFGTTTWFRCLLDIFSSNCFWTTFITGSKHIYIYILKIRLHFKRLIVERSDLAYKFTSVCFPEFTHFTYVVDYQYNFEKTDGDSDKSVSINKLMNALMYTLTILIMPCTEFFAKWDQIFATGKYRTNGTQCREKGNKIYHKIEQINCWKACETNR